MPIDQAPEKKADKALSRYMPEDDYSGLLPFYPGRQYKAVQSAAAKLDCGTLIGTLDGLIVLLKNGKAHSYGPAAVNGPVHQIAVVPGGKKAFGVAGDEDDIATLFSFDEEQGLRQLGFMANIKALDINDVFYCSNVRSVAISPCGNFLAVGADERLGTVVIYKI